LYQYTCVKMDLRIIYTKEYKSADQLDSDVSPIAVMVIVRNMLKLDYKMQVNCVHMSECSFTLLLYILGHPNSISLSLLIREDYISLQENIVGALSLNTLSSELEGYCLMWDLRPYIDDNVMHLAWEMCP
ncbi:hypothetical protein BAE44_0019438, partial [Dichanthelium oligosanthes]